METAKGDIGNVREELDCVREDMAGLQDELESEKRQSEVLYAAMLGVSEISQLIYSLLQLTLINRTRSL